MSYQLPECPTGCEQEPAVVLFDKCNPEIHQGPVEFLYIRKLNSPFTDWTSQAEWAANIDNSGVASTDIRQLHGIGSWAEAASNDIQISGNRTYSGVKTFTITFTVDETNDTNYEWLRSNECNGNYAVWFEDSLTSGDARLYGDNDGIKGYLKANFVIETDENAVHKIMITLTWKSKFHPKRIVSPIDHSA